MFRPSFVVLIYVTVCLRQKDTNYFSVVSKNCQEFLRFPFDIIKAGITLFFSEFGLLWQGEHWFLVNATSVFEKALGALKNEL